MSETSEGKSKGHSATGLDKDTEIDNCMKSLYL